MSEYAQLYVRQSKQAVLSYKQPDAPSLYLLSSYSIPVFWLALFTRADIVLSRISEDDDFDWPHLVSPLPAALDRLLERRSGLMTTFGDFIAPWLEQFHTTLKVAPGAYVHLDTSQIGALAFSGSAKGAEEWRPQLELMLEGYGESLPVPRAELRTDVREDGIDDKWRALYLYGPGKMYEKERRHSVFSYSGAGGDESAPWEEER
jgi:hypothetical protein